MEAFRLKPAQVKSQDPQQFLALESAYQACNSAGFFNPREPCQDLMGWFFF